MEAFFVLLDVAGGAADAYVPVARAGDDHLADREEVVHRVEGVDRAGSAGTVEWLVARVPGGVCLSSLPLLESFCVGGIIGALVRQEGMRSDCRVAGGIGACLVVGKGWIDDEVSSLDRAG